MGAHIGVPIYLGDGDLFGTFCCFSYQPDPSLRERDARVMRFLAGLLGDQLARERAEREAREAAEQRLARVVERPIFAVYQPIFDLETRRVLGFEALARFDTEPVRPPNEWFAEAESLGRGVELELSAIRAGLSAFTPQEPTAFLSLNASPAALASAELQATLTAPGLPPLVIELTEHAMVEDYERIRDAVTMLRKAGIRLAVDDAGAGYASLRHILELRPDFIKLDAAITGGVSHDPVYQALAAALVQFPGTWAQP